MIIISSYQTEKHSKDSVPIDIDLFFEKIRNGTWQEQVDEIRMLKHNFKIESERVKYFTKEEKLGDKAYQSIKSLLKEAKGAINRVTISGKFSNEGRKAENLVSHSGLIDIDIDQPDNLTELKSKLILDEYCQACFITCGGDGLAFICRIDASRIDDSYNGLKEYFYSKYGVSIDPTHKNVANTRNASYDPDIFICEKKATIFKKYPKPKKERKVQEHFIYAQNDFEEIISEIVKRRLDFCDTYENYRNIGFAIGSKFGLTGFTYFDSICQFGDKYNPKSVERDYKKYFTANPTKGISIGTFYQRCKDFNIEIQSKKTARIASVASASRLGGKTKQDTVKNLVKFEGMAEVECTDIVDQVFDNNIEFSDETSLLDDIETYIKHNCDLRKNSLTGKLENYGVEWTEEDVNGLYIAIKKVYDKADARWIERILFSPFIPSYNPLHQFFQENLHYQPDELLEQNEIPTIIRKLWQSIHTDNPNYLEKFGTKWMVSVIAAAHGSRSNLELIFTGKLNAGKSYFFRYILPTVLHKYVAESKLDKGNDDDVLMCQKLIIYQDECAGKSREDEKKHKRLLDKDTFSLRRPYRKDNEDMRRLAVLCGTSNPKNLLSDPHGNRRIIPVNIISRNRTVFDSIDKVDLWMAAYYLWKQGYKWEIDDDDIPELNKSTTWAMDYSGEYELISKYYDRCAENEGELMTVMDVKIIIEEKSGQKISMIKLANELKRIGFLEKSVNEGGIDKNMYRVKFKDVNTQGRYNEAIKSDYF